MYPVDLHMHTVASTHAYSTLSDYIAQPNKRALNFLQSPIMADMEDAPHHWHFINMRILPRVVDGVGSCAASKLTLKMLMVKLIAAAKCLIRWI